MVVNQHQLIEPLSAAILAGGQSRRMGADKALLRLEPNGPPLAALVAECVRAVADDVFLVAEDRPAYADFGIPVQSERIPGRGPLGGISMALRVAAHAHCLIVPCDLPFLRANLLTWLAAQPRDYDLLLPCIGGEGDPRCQPLHAVYAKTCLPAIERRLASGALELRGLAAEVRTRIVTAEEIAALDPTFASFINVNTPDDLALVRRHRRHQVAPSGSRTVEGNPLY